MQRAKILGVYSRFAGGMTSDKAANIFFVVH